MAEVAREAFQIGGSVAVLLTILGVVVYYLFANTNGRKGKRENGQDKRKNEILDAQNAMETRLRDDAKEDRAAFILTINNERTEFNKAIDKVQSDHTQHLVQGHHSGDDS